MKPRPNFGTALYCLAGVIVLGLAFVCVRPSASASESSKERLRAKIAPREVTEKLRHELQQLKQSPNPKRADEVSHQMMLAGYSLASKKDFGAAREAFQTIDREYGGTNSADPDYGTIPDQAKYQAIVCLVAEGKAAEAKKEFRQFLKDRPTSHLAVQAFRRLVRLNKGVEDPNDIALYENAIKAQEAATKRAIAECGPLVVQRFLSEFQQEDIALPDLIKLCKQGEEGTTMLNLAHAFVSHKVGALGRQVNAPDFRHTPQPFVWLMDDHYVLVERISGDEVTSWDPLLHGPRKTKAPASDDTKFQASILVLNP